MPYMIKSAYRSTVESIELKDNRGLVSISLVIKSTKAVMSSSDTDGCS